MYVKQNIIFGSSNILIFWEEISRALLIIELNKYYIQSIDIINLIHYKLNIY